MNLSELGYKVSPFEEQLYWQIKAPCQSCKFRWLYCLNPDECQVHKELEANCPNILQQTKVMKARMQKMYDDNQKEIAAWRRKQLSRSQKQRNIIMAGKLPNPKDKGRCARCSLSVRYKQERREGPPKTHLWCTRYNNYCQYVAWNCSR